MAPATVHPSYMSRLFRRKLPDIPKYVVPAWAQDEGVNAAPWFLDVYTGGDKILEIDLSGQARFLAGRSGNQGFSIDLELGTHDSISRWGFSRAC